MVSRAAMRELCDEGLDLTDVLEILGRGYESPRKRRSGTLERRLRKGRKVYEAVITSDWHHVLEEEVWVLIHVGIFSVKP
jgi:type II secretory pathway component PulF